MTLPLKRKNVFTQEDRELSKILNADALGFQMIWTYFGQNIYQNKINSATFDIRNFNLNLFNHYVIYKLSKIEKLPLLNNRKNIEKILILLENLVVWSWYKEEGFDKTGLSGTTNAEIKWKEKSINTTLSSSRNTLELIQSQHIYGINGKYKGSFISMGFFDSDYRYDETKMQEVEILINENEDLKILNHEVFNWLINENREVEKIPTKSYLAVFGKSKDNQIDKHTKHFWLQNLGFDKDDAKIFYELIDVTDKTQNLKIMFTDASSKSSNNYFNHILIIEPIMAYIDKLFKYLLFLDSKPISDIPSKYFKPIIDFDFKQFELEDMSSVATRIEELSKIKDVKSLIEYHTNLMFQRNKLPWIEIKDDKLKVLMIKHENIDFYKKYLDDKVDDIKSIDWIHDYYKGAVRRIKTGLES